MWLLQRKAVSWGEQMEAAPFNSFKWEVFLCSVKISPLQEEKAENTIFKRISVFTQKLWHFLIMNDNVCTYHHFKSFKWPWSKWHEGLINHLCARGSFWWFLPWVRSRQQPNCKTSSVSLITELSEMIRLSDISFVNLYYTTTQNALCIIIWSTKVKTNYYSQC